MNEPPEHRPLVHLSAAQPVDSVVNADLAIESPVDSSLPASARKTMWSSFALLLDPRWLKNTFRVVFAFAPNCVLPAALFTIGFSTVFYGLFNAVKQLTVQQVQIQNIVTGLIILLVAAVVFLVCVLWSFGLWLVRLNTFCHAYCSIDVPNYQISSGSAPGDSLTPTLLRSLFESAHRFTLKRKKYLAKFYLLVSTVSVIPIALFFIIVSIKLLMLGLLSPMVPKVDFPPVAHFAVTVLLFIVTAYGLALMPTSVVISSLSEKPASVAAWSCIKLTFFKLFPLTAMTIIVSIIQTVITSPQIFFQPSNLLSAEIPLNNIWPTIGSLAWFGATSIVLFTFMLAPFCEMLKDAIE